MHDQNETNTASSHSSTEPWDFLRLSRCELVRVAQGETDDLDLLGEQAERLATGFFSC